jgi:hypothetical protein
MSGDQDGVDSGSQQSGVAVRSAVRQQSRRLSWPSLRYGTPSRPTDPRVCRQRPIDVVKLSAGIVGRGTFEPGWRWPEHVKPIATSWPRRLGRWERIVRAGGLHRHGELRQVTVERYCPESDNARDGSHLGGGTA